MLSNAVTRGEGGASFETDDKTCEWIDKRTKLGARGGDKQDVQAKNENGAQNATGVVQCRDDVDRGRVTVVTVGANGKVIKRLCIGERKKREELVAFRNVILQTKIMNGYRQVISLPHQPTGRVR